MSGRVNARGRLERLLGSQRFAVLATQREGQPHVSLMAFAATPDLKSLLFVTDRDTRKYANLCADPRAAVLVDQRPDRSSGVGEAFAATIVGRGVEVRGDDREPLLEIFVARHLEMKGFADSSALIRFDVEFYELVGGLADVTILRADDLAANP